MLNKLLISLCFCCLIPKASLAESIKKLSPTCKEISIHCTVCSDSKLYVSGTKNKELLKDQNPYSCAISGKSLKDQADLKSKKSCMVLSDFCAVCPDGSFEFTKDRSKISSDLYECATAPRAETFRK